MSPVDWLSESRAILADVLALREELHRHPELGRKEHRTSTFVSETLRSFGIEVRQVADTGVLGILRGAALGRTVALRADMDALPITESTGLSCSSETPGVMHACGHDIHTASLLGAARLLSRHREALAGEVRFLFQPDEEGDGGAKRMIDAGCLDGVEMIFGAHVEPSLPTGSIGFRRGLAYASSNPFDITLHGRASHGAEPENSVDALVAACELVSALQTVVSRRSSPLRPAVLTVGSLNAGTQRNIIADRAELKGIIRCFGTEDRKALISEVERITEGIARAHGLTHELHTVWGYGGIINHPAAAELVRNTAISLLGTANVLEEPYPSMTTEDFGFFLERVPGCFWHIGVNGEKPCGKLHSPFFTPDTAALAIATAMHCALVWQFLST